MIVIGIDPGCAATGVAVVEMPVRQLRYCRTWRGDHEYLTEELGSLIRACQPGIIGVQSPVATSKSPRFYGGDRSGMSLARNAWLAGVLWGAARACWPGAHILAVPPVRRWGLKASERAWRTYWAWPLEQPGGRTSEHARDAAMIALQAWEMTK
jgi:hypothetical protein